MFEKLFSNSALVNALITAVVSAIVTNLFMWWQKRNDYKRDYYKKVVDKRIKAYEQAEVFVACFDGESVDRATGKSWLTCCETLEDAKRTFEELENTNKYSLWLSKECNQCIQEINTVLYPLFRFDEKDEKNFKLHRLMLSLTLSDVIAKHRDELRNIIRKDMMNLHDVDKFFECNKNK